MTSRGCRDGLGGRGRSAWAMCFLGGLISDNVKLSEKYFCTIEAKSSDISRYVKSCLKIERKKEGKSG